MDFIFIVNPVSGNGKSIKTIKAIEEYCKITKVNYKIIYTNKKGEATQIANQFKNDSCTTIFSVGGDGTLNEIVNGVVNSNVKLGIIPSGTGNDFYKTFKDLDVDMIDVGLVNDKFFVNVASLGFDAEIANYANTLKKHNINIPNKLIYILSIFKEYFKYKPVDIEIDGNKKNTTILTICNAKYYGSGFNIAPKAILDDGMFDIIDVESLNKLEVLGLIKKLIKIQHLESNKVNFYRTDSLEINSLIPLNCNIDGEIIKDNNFDFSIIKDGLILDIDNSKVINDFLKIKKIIK